MSRSNRKKKIANSAPQTAGSAPLITSADALRTVRQNKWNPLRSLTPDMLSRVLEQFDRGYFVETVLLWEKMAERDDVIASVKPKREKDVSQLDMQVVADDAAGEEAAAHKDVLEDFWKNVRCVNSYDRNERGGFRRLVKQMMTAVSYRYAAHHIIWEPRADGTLRATFEFVPLWMFENRTGALRYLKNPTAQSGEILTDGEWMVTTGDGLMISCCIGYLAKRSAFNDWLIFSEKFSVPGVLGRTTGKKGSPEAEAMRAAVESFGHDWVAVVYGDDGTHQEPIKLVQAQGNPSAMPMPAVIERVDRKFAALYRGADLSSMSSGSGQGTGASLQDKETDILRRDDAEMIAETLEAVSRMVIEWHFGHGVEPLARVELVVPVAEDASKVIDNGLKLAGAGASVSISALMDRAGLPEAKNPSDRLGQQNQALSTKPEILNQEAVANSAEPLPPAWMDALSADLRPLGKALDSAMRAGDDAAMRAALKKISATMPEFMETAGFEEYLRDQFITALGGENEEMTNAGNSGGAVKGWETRRRNGWQAKPNLMAEELRMLVNDAIDNRADPSDRIEFFGDVTDSEAALLGLGSGWRHGLSRHGIRHMWNSHGPGAKELMRGQIPISREDLAGIPAIIAKSGEAVFAGPKNNVETLRYYYDDPAGGTTTVLEEMRTKWKRLVPVQLVKFKKSGFRFPDDQKKGKE